MDDKQFRWISWRIITGAGYGTVRTLPPMKSCEIHGGRRRKLGWMQMGLERMGKEEKGYIPLPLHHLDLNTQTYTYNH